MLSRWTGQRLPWRGRLKTRMPLRCLSRTTGWGTTSLPTAPSGRERGASLAAVGSLQTCSGNSSPSSRRQSARQSLRRWQTWKLDRGDDSSRWRTGLSLTRTVSDFLAPRFERSERLAPDRSSLRQRPSPPSTAAWRDWSRATPCPPQLQGQRGKTDTTPRWFSVGSRGTPGERTS